MADAFARGRVGGAIDGGFSPALDHDGNNYWPFYLFTSGRIEIQFYWMGGMPPFDQDDKRLEFLRKLNEIPGVELPDDAISRRPAIPLATFAAPGSLPKLFGVIEWFLAEAVSASP